MNFPRPGHSFTNLDYLDGWEGKASWNVGVSGKLQSVPITPFIRTRRANISLIITYYVLCHFVGSVPRTARIRLAEVDSRPFPVWPSNIRRPQDAGRRLVRTPLAPSAVRSNRLCGPSRVGELMADAALRRIAATRWRGGEFQTILIGIGTARRRPR